MFSALENLRTIDPATYDYLQQMAFVGTLAMMVRMDRRIARLARRLFGAEKKIRRLTPPIGVTVIPTTRAPSQPGA